MTSTTRKSFEDTWAFRFLVVGALAMGFSMPLGRLCTALSLLLVVVGAIRGRIRFTMPASAWLWLLFILLAAFSTAQGINPHRGFGKIHKLGWYIGIPLTATLITSKERLRTILCALVGSVTVLALIVLFRNPISAHAIAERFVGSVNHSVFTFGNELIEQGSLADGGRLMVGLVVAFVLLLGGTITRKVTVKWPHLAAGTFSFLAIMTILYPYLRASGVSERLQNTTMRSHFKFPDEIIFQNALFPNRWWVALLFLLLAVASFVILRSVLRGKGRDGTTAPSPRAVSPSGLAFPVLPVALVLIALAEIMALKRGSWFSSIAIVFLLLLRRSSKKWLAFAILSLVAVVLVFSPARTRIEAIPSEFDVSRGGRAAMWTEFAPAIVAEHPFGIGFRSLDPNPESPYSLQSIARRHDIDIPFEKNRDHLHSNLIEMTTSFGWAGLILYFIWMGVIFSDALRGGEETSPVFWCLLALFLNGFVEYNFADAEIVIIFGVLAGLAAAGRRLRQSSNEGQPTHAPLSEQERKEP